MSALQKREAELFALVLTKPAGERIDFLKRECGDDKALRQRLEALLAAHHKSDELSSTPGPAVKATIRLDLAPAEKAGDQIGPYKLLQQIGEGGCGVVYMAEQETPVHRRVALKVIKLGMDTKSVIARFAAERQALALMDHPNIAKVLDAGATETGRPYFVMELVRGIPITDYCDQNSLSVQSRLDLFMQVCRAVQHAHQKGIIHRDLKPSNILVTLNDGVPMPKVIDFGIAKATQGKLTDHTVFTAFEQFMGTPAYMSPEQAEMSALDIDTRSDIYSLGVLLYELLTGKTPFDAKELLARGIEAMRRAIREEEPRRPSTRLTTMDAGELTTTARRHQTDAPKLVHLVRGDLDWIVMKCLEKDRTRRYETANGLALDLHRHISNEPVLARPPSQGYRLQKLARRHKAAFAAAALIAMVLVVATSISVWQAIRATRAETMAKQRLAESEAISKFLTEVFQSPDPARHGRSVTVAETLGTAAKKLEVDLGNQPALQAQLQATLGITYYKLGLYNEAIALQEKVRDYHLGVSGPENLGTLQAIQELANSYDGAGRRDEALKLREQVLALRTKLLGPEHPDTLNAMNNLANSYYAVGRRDEALKLREEVLPLRRKVLGPEHSDTIMAMENLANSYDNAGRRDEALKLREDGLTLRRKVSGLEHPDTLLAMQGLAISYDEAGRLKEALPLREQVLELHRKLSGPEHPDTLNAMNNLANSYDEAGRWNEALQLREQVLALRRKLSGPEHPYTLEAMNNLAASYDEVGHRDEAITLLEEALALYRKVNGPEHPDTLDVMISLAETYDEAGRRDEALKMLEQLVVLRRKVSGPEHPDTLEAMEHLAYSYAEAGRYQEAVALLAKACELDVKNSDASLTLATWQTWFGMDADYEATRRHLVQQAEGTALAETGERAVEAACLRPSTDAALMTNALHLAQRAVELGQGGPALPLCQLSLGMAEYRNGQYKAAEQSITATGQKVGNHDDILGIAHMFYSMTLFREDRAVEARKLFSQAEAQMPPLPKDETKPIVEGRPFSHDLLIWWLAYKEAKSVLNEPDHAKP